MNSSEIYNKVYDSSDVDELFDTVTAELDTNQTARNRARFNYQNSSCSLFKIQQHFGQVERHVYAPMVLSIGPYHHGTGSVLDVERKKFHCLDYVIRLNCNRSLRDYIKAVRRLEREARSCYSDIAMESMKFQKMLLVDGSFILVYLHGTDGIKPTPRPRQFCTTEVSEKAQEAVDPQTENTETMSDELGEWYYSCLVHDLLLLENQIPFMVVKMIYQVLTGVDDTTQLTDNVAAFLEDIFSSYPIAIKEIDRPKDFQHLLHLLHFYFRPSQMPVNKPSRKAQNPRFLSQTLRRRRKEKGTYQTSNSTRWRGALQYHESGIKFKPREFDQNHPISLLDVKFSDGVVEMPCLRIDQNTTYLFRNFVAMEQTSSRFGNDVTAYVIFLAQLMSSSDDVSFLAQKGIVMHQLRSDQEASDHLSKLSEGVVFDFNGAYYTKEIYWEMEKWYISRWNVWNAWLKQTHFKNPWMSLMAVVGIITFGCVVLQTVFSVLAYTNSETIVIISANNSTNFRVGK